MKEESKCQSCGVSLERGAPDDLCPSCLLGGGLLGLANADPEEEEVELIVEKPGDVVGRYKLLKKIGEGGFGVVFRAEQQEPVRRIVALKVIKPGMDSKEVIGRFEAERQALALMDHPNISKIYDAGTTEWGRPYFVMEYVEGRPLTTFCDQEKLNIKERLKLFVRVCAAVQHAHQKGVIHRDLKPSNVLASMAQDDTPFAKVIDFGVAKSVSMELTKETLYTLFGRFVGTPQYMSPEQTELNAVDVDTRSDIYSLGVLLYELMTGCPPIEEESLTSKGMDEVRRMIREVEPLKPSSRVFTVPEGQRRSAASARRIEPFRYRRQLEGDLDWIVMKALEKDRNRRYDTAQGLALDVRRYLKGLPVSAGPPGAAYRIRKFVRRHRVGSVATVLVILTLIVASIGITKGYFMLKKKEKEKSAAMEEATAAKEDAEDAKEDAEAAMEDAKAAMEETTIAKDKEKYERLLLMVSDIKSWRAEEPGSREKALIALDIVGKYDLDEINLDPQLQRELRDSARNELIDCLDWKDLKGEPLWQDLKEQWVSAAFDSDHEHCVLFQDGRLEVRQPSGAKVLESHAGVGPKIGGPLRFSPDGNWVAAGFGSSELWELMLWNWREDQVLKLPQGLQGRSSAFAFHPKGEGFAIGYAALRDRQLPLASEIKFFAMDGSTHREPLLIQGAVLTMEYHPVDPRFLAVGLGADGVVVVDLESEERKTLPGGLNVVSLAWAPDGRTIAVGTVKGNVEILSLDPAGPVRWSGVKHDAPVDQIAWSHDGRLIASGAGDEITNLWDGRQGTHLCKCEALSRTLSFSKDDRWLGPVTPSDPSALGKLAVERSEVCHRARGHRGAEIQAASWTTNKLVLITAAPDGLRFWNREGVLLAHRPEDGISDGGLVCSKNNLYIVKEKGLARRSISFSGTGPDRRLEIGPSEPFGPLSEVSNGGQLLLSPDEAFVAVARDTEVILLDSESGARIHPDKLLDAPESTAYLALSSDGQWLAAGTSGGKTVMVWSMKPSIGVGVELSVAGPATVSFNPSPREDEEEDYVPNLLTGDENFYRLWNWDSDSGVWTEGLKRPSNTANPQGRMPQAVYSPRNTAVVTSFEKRNIQVLGRKSLQLLTQPGFVEQWPLSISPDGELLVTASTEGRLFLWNLKEVIKELKARNLGWRDPVTGEDLLPPFKGETIPLILP